MKRICLVVMLLFFSSFLLLRTNFVSHADQEGCCIISDGTCYPDSTNAQCEKLRSVLGQKSYWVDGYDPTCKQPAGAEKLTANCKNVLYSANNGCCVLSNGACVINSDRSLCSKSANSSSSFIVWIDGGDPKCQKISPYTKYCSNGSTFCQKDADCGATEYCSKIPVNADSGSCAPKLGIDKDCTCNDSCGAGLICSKRQDGNLKCSGGSGGIPCAANGTTKPSTNGNTQLPINTGTTNPSASNTVVINFPNPLQCKSLDDCIGSILISLRSIVVILSLIFIVIGAIMYITSVGNDKRMTTAKGAITAALIGLALAIAAPSFLKEIGGILGWTPNNQEVIKAPTLTQIAFNVLNFLLSIVGILGMIMLVIGGIMYTTAAGDEDRSKTAKKIVTYAIVGIVIALASLLVVKQIGTLLS